MDDEAPLLTACLHIDIRHCRRSGDHLQVQGERRTGGVATLVGADVRNRLGRSAEAD
jgi:hypothetical protein